MSVYMEPENTIYPTKITKYYKNVNITSPLSTDHSDIVLQVFSPGQTTTGRSHWKLNVTLLENEQYLNKIKANLSNIAKYCYGNS